MKRNTQTKRTRLLWSVLSIGLIYFSLTAFKLTEFETSFNTMNVNPDVNGDGELNILVLGTNNSVSGDEEFSPDLIVTELQNILSADAGLSLEVNVVAENIHQSQVVTVGLGGGGTPYNWTHHSHSLTQYYYWPNGLEERMNHLSGNGDTDWDYVAIGADPHIVAKTPGYYALGVNKIAAKVAEGGGVPLLLMMWPQDEAGDNGSIEHFEEFTYRTADGAKVPLEAIPAGLAWDALPEDKKDTAGFHPSPNGAYITAAAIYAHLLDQSAAETDYSYDDEIADIAASTVTEAASQEHYSGLPTFISPFKSCDITDDVINYNHTGTSSENGIKQGLQWVFNQAPHTLQNGGPSPIDLNYGRANSNFEANKRYKINPELFNFSFGFPMQDHSNNGDVSMLYGLDRRQSGTMNDTDLGVARFMVEEEEIPYARAIPVRTLFAQMKEVSPEISAYRDSWHMHRDLDKAIASYMYTILTGNCALGVEPEDTESDDWKTWMAHKIGFETAWTLMYMQGDVPDCSLLVDSDEDGFNALVDCDDNNADINPNQEEIPYNGIDEDCNPATFDDDFDQDGFLAADDCDDNNPGVNPNQTEVPYNGIDDDCNAATFDDDLDQDGFTLADDCDDNNPGVNPNQTEIPYNGIDDDCNAETLDDDLDQDGFALVDDCDDNNPGINPNQEEIPYNGIDEDCNAATPDDDLDQDGFALADDCDDNNASANPDQQEVPYNGIDDDCNTETLDDDLDQDGFALVDDCDDNNAGINPDQTEVPYNGIDEDCNTETLDDDLDQDGFALADDCDDENAAANPAAVEIPNNGIDEDCDGSDLISSLDELTDSKISIYPNPTEDLLTIELSNTSGLSEDLKIEVFDCFGRVLQQGTLGRNSASASTTISLENYSVGTYFVKCYGQDFEQYFKVLKL